MYADDTQNLNVKLQANKDDQEDLKRQIQAKQNEEKKLKANFYQHKCQNEKFQKVRDLDYLCLPYYSLFD